MTISDSTSILYFDDEQSCLDVFTACFGDDYEVTTVSSLIEARNALRKGKFDIVISDQLMPEIDGLTFLRKVAATNPETYRVMLTGSIGVGAVIREVSAGIIHLFVAKPWTEAEMRQALTRGSMSWVPEHNNEYSARRNYLSRSAA
jgi:DNA-binding NtrC family response regulator